MLINKSKRQASAEPNLKGAQAVAVMQQRLSALASVLEEKQALMTERFESAYHKAAEKNAPQSASSQPKSVVANLKDSSE